MILTANWSLKLNLLLLVDSFKGHKSQFSLAHQNHSLHRLAQNLVTYMHFQIFKPQNHVSFRFK